MRRRFLPARALALLLALCVTLLLFAAGCARRETAGESVELWFLTPLPEEPGDLAKPALQSVPLEVGRQTPPPPPAELPMNSQRSKDAPKSKAPPKLLA